MPLAFTARTWSSTLPPACCVSRGTLSSSSESRSSWPARATTSVRASLSARSPPAMKKRRRPAVPPADAACGKGATGATTCARADTQAHSTARPCRQTWAGCTLAASATKRPHVSSAQAAPRSSACSAGAQRGALWRLLYHSSADQHGQAACTLAMHSRASPPCLAYACSSSKKGIHQIFSFVSPRCSCNASFICT